MIELIFKTKDGVTAIQERNEKVFLVDGYVPSTEVEISASRKLKEVPANWDLENILKAAYDVCELKRGLGFALRILDQGEDINKVRDTHAKRVIAAAEKMIAANFEGETLIAFADVIRDINRRLKRSH